MNNYQSITASPEALAAFLGSIPAIETPWDGAFHRLYCSSCSAADCDDCRRPERDSPLWWLGLPAAEAESREMNADFSHTCEGCEHVVTEPWAKDIISYRCFAPGRCKGRVVGVKRFDPYIPAWCPKLKKNGGMKQ